MKRIIETVVYYTIWAVFITAIVSFMLGCSSANMHGQKGLERYGTTVAAALQGDYEHLASCTAERLGQSIVSGGLTEISLSPQVVLWPSEKSARLWGLHAPDPSFWSYTIGFRQTDANWVDVVARGNDEMYLGISGLKIADAVMNAAKSCESLRS